MGFNYDKHKDHAGQDSMWTSYSDLFLGLSIIFLLLYVSASLKQGTDGLKQHQEYKRLVKESEDLKQQLKVYETLKQDYLAKQASADEQATYEELMGKLDLLQDEAKDEKKKLEMQANENAKKAQALNKYQQVIRNIINSNMLAKARIKSRDTMIDTNEEQIDDLEGTVQEKSKEIAQRNQKIDTLEDQLDKKMKDLDKAYKAQKISKKKFEEQQRALRKDAESKIMALRESNERAQRELDETNRELAETSTQLNQAQGTVAKLGQEKERLEGELSAADGKHREALNKMKGDFDAAQAKARGEFEAALAKEKLSGAAKAAREAAFKADAERKAGELAGRMADLDRKYKETQGQLAKATENLNAKKNLAKSIKDNFKKYGVQAEVDEGTGDVMLSFGDEYFSTGQAELKPKMRAILEQAMPAYSASLFEDAKIANKIQSVEIVGFASPTYKGKFVDPKNMDPENRAAVNYNLDLSYNRARSIFNHVFDKSKMSFKHQERLLPMVKVTGRSFLANDKNRDPAGGTGSAEQFCRQNDCAKLQRVIIKFTLKD